MVELTILLFVFTRLDRSAQVLGIDRVLGFCGFGETESVVDEGNPHLSQKARKSARRVAINSAHAFLEVGREGRLLLDAKSEACSRAHFLHAGFLEPDALLAGIFKRPEPRA
jgi:hypothetical protein